MPGPAKALAKSMLKPKPESRVLFLRSLSVMVSAGIPIDRALHHLALQAEDKAMSQICNEMADRVSQGFTISNAFAAYPVAFSQLQIRLIQVGERTGNIDRVLSELSEHEEKERATLMKIKGSLTYPMFTLVVASLMMIFVPPYIMKGLFGMIQSSGVEPPLITIIVLHITNFLRSPLFYIGFVAITAAAVVFGPPWLQAHRRSVSLWLLSLPVIGKLYRTIGIARFSRALGLQLDCGTPSLVAIMTSGEASDNPILEEAARAAQNGLKNGGTISHSLQESGFFPNLLIKMVQVGEESGQLSDLLDRTAEMYEQNLDAALESFTALLEPMVMMVMGVLVGILVLSTMLPMMQVLQHL